jgi:hypothetical protein
MTSVMDRQNDSFSDHCTKSGPLRRWECVGHIERGSYVHTNPSIAARDVLGTVDREIRLRLAPAASSTAPPGRGHESS